MAIIYSYPINTNILATDIIVGSTTVVVNGKQKNQTKNFEIGDLATYFNSVIAPPGSYVPYTGAIAPVDLGAFALTATSIVKAGGTNLQYLLADGSVTTGPVLTGFVPYTGATQAVNLGAFNLTVNSISVGRGGGGLATNTVLGNSALSANVTGTQITAIGNLALNVNTANNNTAVGFKAMTTNTTGNTNTSVGSESLQTNLSGNENSAFGYRALYLSTAAAKNNAVGRLALGNILTGSQNVGVGNNAGLLTSTVNQNTASQFSVYIGNDTKPFLDGGTNEIVIGYNANGIGSNSVVLGNTSILTTVLRGNVGIGTTIPGAKLDVSGTARIISSLTIDSSAPPSFGNLVIASTNSGSIISANPGSSNGSTIFLDLSINNSSKARITSDGKVGIGTIIPTSKLQVVGLLDLPNNSAATSAGLTVGAFYHTAGVVKVVI